MILVSACLAGINCRYDGGTAPVPDIVDLYESGEAIAVCPEVLGGLATPRLPAQFRGGTGEDVLVGKARVVRSDGVDVTGQFLGGAHAVLRIMKEIGLNEAILKARSPSCGKGLVRNDGRIMKGNGVCAALLLRQGCKVIEGGV
jgi:uncharacterized protein YbbK (DUF523 family)